MPLTPEQIKEAKKLEAWFAAEIGKIKKRQAEIIKKYEAKKAAFTLVKVRGRIKQL